MKMMRRVLAVLLLSLLPACIAAAGGAGGVGFGAQYYDPVMSSSNLGMAYIMGFGYGVDEGGSRVGGFGMALFSAPGRSAGGAGGLLVGHEWRAGPVVFAFNFLGGVGGAAYAGGGYMLLFGQADLELGAAVLPWMQVVLYAGYQAWGNLIPGIPFVSAKLFTPVLGVRVSWGGF
jgi:hypothetical protein